MKNKFFSIIVLCILGIVLTAQAFLVIKLYKLEASLSDYEPKEEKEVVEVDTSVVNVSTPYGVLNYPSTWIDEIMVEDGEGGEGYTLIFSASLGEKKATLFSVTFDDEKATGRIGTIERDGKNVPVAINESLLNPADWSAEQYQKLTEMMKIKDAVKDSIFNE